MDVPSATRDYTVAPIQALFTRWITSEIMGGFIQQYIQRETERTQKKHRFYERLLPPLVTLWLMIYQRLNADHTCDAALSAFRAGHALGAALSESNSGYCQARQRLPLTVIADCLQYGARRLRQEFGEAGKWHGRDVGLLDGSTLRLPATQALHDHYGVSENQHGENHWPLMRLLAVFHLFSGAAEGVVEADYHTGELSMVRELLKQFSAGWIWVGDCLFGVYRVVQISHFLQQDVLVRLGSSQYKRFVDRQPLASGTERAVIWKAKTAKSVETDLPILDIAGRLLYVCVERDGFRPMDVYLFTTLTDADRYPIQDLLSLYCRRWTVELNLRHLKTTLEMEDLQAKTVDMVRKELLVGLLAYTLVRAVMGQSAIQTNCSPLALSFVRCLRRILDSLPSIAVASASEALVLWDDLLSRLSRCQLPIRSQPRSEPRRVWGKPRVFPTIKGSRDQARAEDRKKWASAIS